MKRYQYRYNYAEYPADYAAFIAGNDAYKDGYAKKNNPYAMNTLSRIWWSRGWKAAYKQDKRECLYLRQKGYYQAWDHPRG
jgi:hypothetical protein